jgi:hypothetical protein
MHHVINIIISIVNGTLNDLFMCLVPLSGLSHVGTITLIYSQQFFFLQKNTVRVYLIHQLVSGITHMSKNQAPYPQHSCCVQSVLQ